MPNTDETPERIWKFQKEKEDMHFEPTADELCAMARSREKFNARVKGAMFVVLMIGFAAMLLYNLFRLNQPWLRLGQAWTLGVVVYLFAPLLERGRDRIGADEPCARFLERQHEERRLGYLRIRDRLFLFIPGIAASYWGRGAALWLFVMVGVALVLAWIGFWKAAEKAARERDDVHRSIG